ncbi:MAG TPA: hypothetical protein VKK31_29750 [Thermoanaerobaculia bacterium]|nr:hypothetical protein [Thermoanaerobaculia bacterium]
MQPSTRIAIYIGEMPPLVCLNYEIIEPRASPLLQGWHVKDTSAFGCAVTNNAATTGIKARIGIRLVTDSRAITTAGFFCGTALPTSSTLSWNLGRSVVDLADKLGAPHSSNAVFGMDSHTAEIMTEARRNVGARLRTNRLRHDGWCFRTRSLASCTALLPLLLTILALSASNGVLPA